MEVEITSAFVHAGGAIELRCRLLTTALTSGARATTATLLVTKVDSVNPPGGSTPQQ
jgi:hypothetical protein